VARILHGYWRSSAAYRVRIALAVKGLEYRQVFVNLRTGMQSGAEFKSVNAQGFVPFLQDGEVKLRQSLAIIEYLEETYPEPPLLPVQTAERARVRALAQVVACDVHPINNLRVLKYLASPLNLSQVQVDAWARHWIESGFATLEAEADATSQYLCGDRVTLADLCLVPQFYNARRVAVDLTAFPQLAAIEARLMLLPAFAQSRPEVQADAVA
jgi:maleylacetoacetate isomerase